MKDISIRRAKITDGRQANMLQDEIFEEDFRKYGYCPSYGRSLEWTENLIQRRHVYLIHEKENVVGIAVIRLHGMECHISSIGIRKKYQGKGIGAYMMEWIEGQYSDAWVFTLDTYWDKKENIQFYKKLGYEITGAYQEGSLKFACFKKKARH